jgi:hypothetical protein
MTCSFQLSSMSTRDVWARLHDPDFHVISDLNYELLSPKQDPLKECSVLVTGRRFAKIDQISERINVSANF